MNTKDYLPFYTGCFFMTPDGLRKSLCINTYFDLLYVETQPEEISPSKAYFTYHISKVKIALRPLSDMTEEEMNECGNLDYDFSDDEELNKWDWQEFSAMLTANQFLYLLSKHFDLFGLIESGLAIDKTKL